MNNRVQNIKLLFVICAISIMIFAIFLIDFDDLSFANNVIPYILIALSLLATILTIVIKPVKDNGRKILILNLLECLAFGYLVAYIIFIIEKPDEVIRYLRLIPVGCAFIFAEMVKKKVREEIKAKDDN